MSAYFFGYGSLVNRRTHHYSDAHTARLQGWRRAWVCTPARDGAFLSVMPDTSCTIDGLIAAVPHADWTALDAREAGYTRQLSNGAVTHPLDPGVRIAHYAVPAENTRARGDHVIVLSYLDVVVQGFLEAFGAQGVARFFDTTDNWDIPILNDRAAPRYPRHQQLTPAETALVDHHLTRLAARVQ